MEPMPKKVTNETGVNFNNRHQWSPEEKHNQWESGHGLNLDPHGTWKDINDMNLHEVDLKNDKSGGIGLKEKDNVHDR